MAVAKTSYASPATETAAAFFDAMPDELSLKILTMAATKLYVRDFGDNGDWWHSTSVDHDFLVDVLIRVSQRFERLAKDPSLWKGSVVISQNAGMPGKADFVVRQCFHRGTRQLVLRGAYDHEDGARVIICGDPVSMFPSLNFLGDIEEEVGEPMLVWETRREEESDDETA